MPYDHALCGAWVGVDENVEIAKLPPVQKICKKCLAITHVVLSSSGGKGYAIAYAARNLAAAEKRLARLAAGAPPDYEFCVVPVATSVYGS
jgi:hypothetical protein